MANDRLAEELEPLIEEHLSKNEALVEAAQPAEESEEEEIIPRSPKMDTDGKPIGKLIQNQINS